MRRVDHVISRVINRRPRINLFGNGPDIRDTEGLLIIICADNSDIAGWVKVGLLEKSIEHCGWHECKCLKQRKHIFTET